LVSVSPVQLISVAKVPPGTCEKNEMVIVDSGVLWIEDTLTDIGVVGAAGLVVHGHGLVALAGIPGRGDLVHRVGAEQQAVKACLPVRAGGALQAGVGVLRPIGGLYLNRVNSAPSKGVPASSVLMMRTLPQLLTLTGAGGTKSFSAAVNESDERLLR